MAPGWRAGLGPASDGPRSGRRRAPRAGPTPPPLCRRPGVAHLPRCPRPPCPGTAASSGLAGPGAAAAASQCPRRGPGWRAGKGVTPARRAAVHAHPALSAAGPASAPRRFPCLHRRARAPQLRPAQPLPLGGRRAPSPYPALPTRLTPTPARRTRPARATPGAGRRASEVGAYRPSPAAAAASAARWGSASGHVTVSLAGVARNASHARLPHRAVSPTPRDQRASRSGRGARVAVSRGELLSLLRVLATPARSGLLQPGGHKCVD